jgi:hypothetical protein
MHDAATYPRCAGGRSMQAVTVTWCHCRECCGLLRPCGNAAKRADVVMKYFEGLSAALGTLVLEL